LQNKPNPHTIDSRVTALITLLGIAVVIFVLDRITKSLVVQNLPLYASWAPVPALERLFKIIHLLNTGAAFGLFPDGGNIFMVVAILVALAIVYYVSTYPSLPWIVRLSLGLQLGGAVGNMWDRVQQGAVTDFVDIGFWPIFNIADMSIVLGVTLLAFWLWQEDVKAQQADAVNPL